MGTLTATRKSSYLTTLGFRVFSGKDAGCQPDNPSFDNSAAITATIAAAANVGGKAYFTAGIYYLTSAPTGAANCQVALPYVPFTDGSGNRVNSKQVTIVGEGMIPWLETGLPEYPSAIPTTGTLFYSTATGSGTYPAVFGALGQTTAYGQYTNLDVKFQDLTVRVKANNTGAKIGPTMCGINMQWAATSAFEQVRADVDARGPDTVEPTQEVFGIRPTKTNGQTNVTLINTLAIGYKYGYVRGEHTKGFNAQSFCCTHGSTFTASTHGQTDVGFLAQWCRYSLSAGQIDPGPVTLEVISASFEYKRIGQWFDTVAIVYDPQNYLYGNMKYIVVASGPGKDNSKFSKVGGANFFCYPTGYDYATTSTAPTATSPGTASGGHTGGTVTGTPATVTAGTPILYASDPAITYATTGGGWAQDLDPNKTVYMNGDGKFSGGVGSEDDNVAATMFFLPLKRYLNLLMPTSAVGAAKVIVKFGPAALTSFSQSDTSTHAAYVLATVDLGATWNANGYGVRLVNAGSSSQSMFFGAAAFYDTLAAAQADAGGSGTATASGATYSDSAGRTYQGAWTPDTAKGVYSDGHPGQFSSTSGDSYSQTGSANSSIDIWSPRGANLGPFDVYVAGVKKGSYTAKQSGATQASALIVSIAVSAGTYAVKVVSTAGGASNVLLSDKIVFN